MNTPKLSWVENIGMVAGIAGATLLASATAYSRWGFVLFLLSATMIIIASYWRDSKPMILLNSFYLFINVIGILRWFNVL